MIERLCTGDLIHFYNPNCDPSTLWNWWSERYGIVSGNHVLVVAEKKGGAWQSWHLVYPRFHLERKWFATRNYRVTKRIQTSFLGFKYAKWVMAEFADNPSVYFKNREDDPVHKTLVWFETNFYNKFR